MVTMATNPFRESMGQSMTCMGALHPHPKFICLHQFNVTKQRKDLHLTFTIESKCVDLNGSIANQFVSHLMCMERLKSN